MPTKYCKEMKFGFIAKDGTVIDLPNEMTDLHIDPDQLNERFQSMINRISEAISFEIQFLREFGIDEIMIKHWICNNWRKHHGLPMMRKRYGRSV